MEQLYSEVTITNQQTTVRQRWHDYLLWILFCVGCLWVLTRQHVHVEAPKELVVVTKNVCQPTPQATE